MKKKKLSQEDEFVLYFVITWAVLIPLLVVAIIGVVYFIMNLFGLVGIYA